MQSTRGIDEIFIPLKKSHSGNIQQNVVGVVVLAVSSSRSDPILRRKWWRLREMHTYGAATSPPSSVQQVGWRDGLDLQHDGVVLWWRVSAAGLRLHVVGRKRERKGSSWQLGFWGEGRVRPLPNLYRGMSGPLAPPPSPRAAAPR